ncbi:hypothetical protein [Pseudoduganella namucuonensis]|uniref:Uncharacterized protein n=1 Tax=Pseudoduganella namucuonensis TaxID=1035707 RepID=A0A1I7K9A3_9BURK|nr:hypothetical protein [Pseudoduganella namucuonensis]SFU94009.1 hypothetical protein SAMN05216552_1015130 [Pseudoduganella namucuonensis]
MSPAARYPLPAPPEVGPPPPYRLGGNDIALEDAADVIVEVYGPSGMRLFTLEQTLRSIDLIAEPGRTRILYLLPLHFDMPGGKP